MQAKTRLVCKRYSNSCSLAKKKSMKGKSRAYIIKVLWIFFAKSVLHDPSPFSCVNLVKLYEYDL